MSQKQKLKEKEVRWARAFLHALNANESNGYLLLAVLSWLRDAKGPWNKNNPLNLKNAAGKTLYFASYTASAIAAAQKIRRSHDLNLHKLARRVQDPAKADAQLNQALDFLKFLALSKWDADHYGMTKNAARLQRPGVHKALGYTQVVDPAHPEKNILLKGFYDLTGTHIPKSWFVDTVTTKVRTVTPAKERPTQPRTTWQSPPHFDYIDPYAQLHFYEARKHAADMVLPDTLVL